MSKRKPQTVRRAWLDYKNAIEPDARIEQPLKNAFYAGAAWMSSHVTMETNKADIPAHYNPDLKIDDHD